MWWDEAWPGDVEVDGFAGLHVGQTDLQRTRDELAPVAEGGDEFVVDQDVQVDVEGAGALDGEVFCRQAFSDGLVGGGDARHEQRRGDRQANYEDEALQDRKSHTA